MEADLAAVSTSQQESQAGATHEEAKPEGDKDTRATESSYLARGLAKRVGELKAAVTVLAKLNVRAFAPGAAVALTALVTVEDEDGAFERFFVAPAGGGRTLPLGKDRVMVLTPTSPMARALIGRSVDDDVELQTPQGKRELVIVGVE